jgi:lipopolysaccharide/colanic/teichoic acid biosynthesis glycosyltransferase
MLTGSLELAKPPSKRSRPDGLYGRYLKRALDLLLLMLMVPIVVPIVLLLAILIKADNGPVFYCQDRVGRGGRIFRMWKLRSMKVNADLELQALLDKNALARLEWSETQKLRHDPRVTPIGRFIRKSSLDELPQLWNVLLGDMSFVGPRPFLPDQRNLYPGDDYYLMRPGLTGLWQTSERNASSFCERASYDSRYCRESSIRTDLRILLATVGVVLRGTGY